MFPAIVLNLVASQHNAKLLASAACVVSLFASGFAANAAEEIGKSVKIKNTVNGSIGNRSLAPRDPVFVSESIRAGSNSHGEILLNDRSKVLVGENSVISLDDFVVGGRGFDSGTVKVAKGAFRFITGNSKKGSMKIETPISTIGVRGTVFDVYVAPSGVTRVVLFKGEVRVCSRSGSQNCITTNNACDIIEVNNSGVQELPYLRAGERAEEDEVFGLTSGQGRFQRAWRAPVISCNVRAALDPDNPNKKRKRRNGPFYTPPDDTPGDVPDPPEDDAYGYSY